MSTPFARIIRPAFLASLLALSGASLAGKSMSGLVSEDAQLFISVRSLPELRDAWTNHAIRERLDEAGLTEMLEGIAGDRAEGEEGFVEVLENEFDLAVDELFELLPGGASVALFNLTDLVTEKADNPDLLIMAEFGGSAERLEELMQIQFERNAKAQKEINPEMEHEWVRETFMGETLHFDEAFDGETTYVEDGYALVDGIFILGAPEARLRAAVESIKGAGLPPLSDLPGFLRTREEFDRSDLTLYANLTAIMPQLDRAIREIPPDSGMAVAGMSPDTLADALALDAMEALSVDLTIGERDLTVYSAFLWGEKRGLLSLLTYGDGGLPEAHYVPEGVVATSISRFDLSAMLAHLEELLGRSSPNLPVLFDMQLQKVKQQTGVDLRLSVLENLGDEIVSLSVFDKAAGAGDVLKNPQEVYIFELRDGALFSAAMEAFKDLVPGMRARLREQEYEGQTIYTVKGYAGPDAPHDSVNDVSYTVKRSHLFLSTGRIGLLQEVLSRFEDRAGGFWASAETEAMFDLVARPGPISRSFMDVGGMAEFLLDAFVRGFNAGGAGLRIDTDAIPAELDLPLVFVSESNESGNGAFSRGALLIRDRD